MHLRSSNKLTGSALLLSILWTTPTYSLASRNNVFQIEVDGSRTALRGRASDHRRLRVSDRARTENSESHPRRKMYSTWDESDSPDLSVLGVVKKRRFGAMDAINHSVEMLLALRFSSSMSMTLVSLFSNIFKGL
jgi:hypothetical protein